METGRPGLPWRPVAVRALLSRLPRWRLLSIGFDQLVVDRIHAVVDPRNPRSMAVAERIGMKHVGRTDRYYGLPLEHFVVLRA